MSSFLFLFETAGKKFFVRSRVFEKCRQSLREVSDEARDTNFTNSSQELPVLLRNSLTTFL